jgi:hypothetical protein
MKGVQKAIAILMAASVLQFYSLPALGSERDGPPASASQRSTSLPAQASPGRTLPRIAFTPDTAVAPHEVSGSVGQVSRKRLPDSSVAWYCNTGAESGVVLELSSTSKLDIYEHSRVSLTVAPDTITVTLLHGSVAVEGAAGRMVYIRTFGGTYVIDGDARGRARFSWREGRLLAEGKTRQAVEASASSGPDVLVTPTGVASGSVAVRVTDPNGNPVLGVPVVFSPGPSGGRTRVAFAGSANARVLTDSQGVARTAIATLGGGPSAVVAAVEGAVASATVPVDTPRTTGKQKLAALIALGAVAAVTAAIVVHEVHRENPVLTPSR